jgi:hypothetical protein
MLEIDKSIKKSISIKKLNDSLVKNENWFIEKKRKCKCNEIKKKELFY